MEKGETSMAKLRGVLFVSCITILTTISLCPAVAQSSKPADLNVRIVGTANFQGRYTALIEDMNTHTDSFYKVGDPIYGYRIEAISGDGVKLEKNGKTSFLAFEAPKTILPATDEAAKAPAQAVASIATPSSEEATRNFYTAKASKSTTRWDLFTPKKDQAASKKPSLAGVGDKKAKTVASSSSSRGRFGMPIARYKRLSSKFGYRKHPIGGGTKMHKGIDFSANRGTRILSAAGGVVKFSGWKSGFGYTVIVDHQNGYETLYAHCSKLIADTGDNVGRGDLIAEVGSTGASTGNHLHFEVHRNGTPIDPAQFLPSI